MMRRVNIVMYHYVRDLTHSRFPSIKGLDTALFRRQLDDLNARYKIIRMENLLEASAGGHLPENAMLLTFDDGYIDHYTTVFPLLDQMGLQGSFFPPSRVLKDPILLDVNKIHFTLAAADESELYQALIGEIDAHRGQDFDFPDTKSLIEKYAKETRFDSGEIVFIKKMLQTVLPERLRERISDNLFRHFVGAKEAVLAKELYCDTAQLATLKRHGMFIGIHGYNHGWLGNMKQAEYERDISQALDFMDSAGLIDPSAWVMNYPYGSWNNGVVDYIASNGCLLGLTTRVAVADLQTDNLWTLPRFDTNDFPPKSENYKKYL